MSKRIQIIRVVAPFFFDNAVHSSVIHLRIMKIWSILYKYVSIVYVLLFHFSSPHLLPTFTLPLSSSLKNVKTAAGAWGYSSIAVVDLGFLLQKRLHGANAELMIRGFLK